jgi:phage host-nuclease inhibitor protein Gam
MSPKKPSINLRSFDEVDQALLDLGRVKAIVQHEEAILNNQIQNFRDDFDQRTSDARKQSAALENEIEKFCIDHKDEFEKTRSKDFVHGTVGFRTSPPAVKALNRKYNWSTILELIKKLRLAQYIRTSEEVDKEAILADYAGQCITDEKLAAIGVKVDQIEQFKIDIKWDTINA